MRVVAAPMYDATFGAMPCDCRYSRYSPSDVQAMSYLMSVWRSLASVFISGGQRPERIAFAEHFERDALPQIALRLAIDDQRLDGPAQHVHEARRDRLAGGVDDDFCGVAARLADVDDAIAVDDDVADVTLATGTIENRAAAHDEVMTRRFDGRLLRAASQQNQDQAAKSRHGRDLEASGVGAQYSSPKEKGARRRPSREKGDRSIFRSEPVGCLSEGDEK